MHGQPASTMDMNKLMVELGFKQEMKVVVLFEIYNFHEESFFNF